MPSQSEGKSPVLSIRNRNKKGFTEDQIELTTQECLNWVESMTDAHCLDHKGSPTLCECMKNINQHEFENLSNEMTRHTMLSCKDHSHQLKQWTIHSNAFESGARSPCCLLPGENTLTFVCCNALCTLFGVGKKSWPQSTKPSKKTLKSHVD